MRASTTATTQSMVLAGLGVCRVHDLIAAPFVKRGELVEVLSKFVDDQRVPVFAVMLPERQRLPKIKACVEFWAEWLPQYAGAQR